MFQANVSSERITVHGDDVITSGAIGKYIEFTYGTDWADFTKIICFTNGDIQIDYLSNTSETEVIEIPHEVMRTAGKTIRVGIYGQKENTVLPTLWSDLAYVSVGTDPNGDESTDPSIPMYSQLHNNVGNVDDLETSCKKNLVCAINELFSSEATQVQSDWNQNDETKPDYIKNRICYDNSSEAVYIPEKDYTFDTFNGQLAANNILTELPIPNIGDFVNVIFDKVRYKCEVKLTDGRPCFGNISLLIPQEANTGEPFMGICETRGSVDLGLCVVNTGESSVHNIKATVLSYEIHKIDAKYLPEMVGKRFGNEYDSGEIFNDYMHNRALARYSHVEGEGRIEKFENVDVRNVDVSDRRIWISQDIKHISMPCVLDFGVIKIIASNFSSRHMYVDSLTDVSGLAIGTYTMYVCGGIALANSSHVEGAENITNAKQAHAEGNHTVVTSVSITTSDGNTEVVSDGRAGHAEGIRTLAAGRGAHAEGIHSSSVKDGSHSEGADTTASGESAHAEGGGTTASGYGSHAEGGVTKASGYGSHSEGADTTASGDFSHAEGGGTTASGENQHVQGRYNIDDPTGKYAHIVGNGSARANSNAHTLDWHGNAWFQGNIKVGGIGWDDPNAKEVGGGEKPWRLIGSADLDGNWPEVTFSTDAEGKPFKLKDVFLLTDSGVAGKRWIGLNGVKDGGSNWSSCLFLMIAPGMPTRIDGGYFNMSSSNWYGGKNYAETIYFQPASATNGHIDVYGRDA